MASIENDNSASRHRPGVRRPKKHSLKTDMTPMVDLGFLLVAFFVFTSELSQPRVADLYMPKEGKDMPVARSSTLTILLGAADKVYYFHGDWDSSAINMTTYSTSTGIGKVIREKQQQLDAHPVNSEGREGLMLIIKPGPDANYKNIVDALDEAMINDVKKYAIVKCEPAELRYLFRLQD